MGTLLVYLFLVVLIVLFAVQNMTPVPVYFFVAGQPIEVPLIIVVGLAFFIGFVTAILGVIRKALKRQKRDVVMKGP